MKLANRILILALMVAVSVAAGCGGEQANETAADVANAPETSVRTGGEKGDVAPDFTLPRVDGGQLSLSDLRGKAVLVDFWDTWCPPCKRALPHLQELSETYKDDLVVVGVAFGQEGEQKVRSYVNDNGLTFEMVLFQPSSTVLTDFGGVQSIPTTFLIDAEGVVREKWVGGQDKTTYEQAVKGLIGG